MFYFLHFQKEGSGGVSDALFNAALFISFGALHSLLARNFAKAQAAKLVGEHFVRIVFVFSGQTGQTVRKKNGPSSSRALTNDTMLRLTRATRSTKPERF
jgi:hypothetical protein